MQERQGRRCLHAPVAKRRPRVALCYARSESFSKRPQRGERRLGVNASLKHVIQRAEPLGHAVTLVMCRGLPVVFCTKC